MQVFTDYATFEQFVLAETECKLFSGRGINYRSDKRTCILKSVDGTPFYDDNLSDPNHPQYTLYGQVGDQDETNMSNKNLLNPVRTEKIYLYRRTSTEWIWYGRYVIKSKYEKQHPDKDGVSRKIIILNLERYCPRVHTPIMSKKTIQLSLVDQQMITPSSTLRRK